MALPRHNHPCRTLRHRHARGDARRRADRLPPAETGPVGKTRKIRQGERPVAACPAPTDRPSLSAAEPVSTVSRSPSDGSPLCLSGRCAAILRPGRRVRLPGFQCHLVRHRFVNTPDRQRPVRTVDGEIPIKGGQGLPADPAVNASASARAKGDAGGAVGGGAGFCLANNYVTSIGIGVSVRKAPDEEDGSAFRFLEEEVSHIRRKGLLKRHNWGESG